MAVSVRNLGSRSALGSEWDALVHAHNGSHPLLLSTFLNPMLHAQGRDGLVLAELRDGRGTLRNAAVLERCNRIRWSLFCPSQQPVAPLVGAAATMRQFLRALPAALRSCLVLDVLRLDELVVPVDSIVAAREATWQRRAQTMTIAKQGESFEAYWTSRSKSLRKSIRRAERDLARDLGDVGLLELGCPEAIVEGVTGYAEIEQRGWKARVGTALGVGNEQVGLYTSIMEAFAQDYHAASFFLTAAGRPLASRLVVFGPGGIAVILKTTYDEDYADYRPGWVLLYRLLDRLWTEPGIRRIEFYTDASEEQLRWATEARWIVNCSLFRWSWLAFMARSRMRWMRGGGELGSHAADADQLQSARR